MSTDADTNAHESQFQNIGDLVERNDETGVMSVESLCMNCHENVCDYTRYDKLHTDL
jgi:zinc finger protein